MLESIFVISLLIESIVETVSLVVAKEGNWKMIVAGVHGAAFAYFFGINLLDLIGLTPAVEGLPVVIFNVGFFGILSARFSGAANDLLEYLKNLG